jgi:hypothetical protein
MAKTHSELEMMASRGSMILTPAAYTWEDIPPFKTFRPSKTACKITVLKSVTDSADAASSGVDSLAKHITGGAATEIEPPDLIICQDDRFTDITVTITNITIYF